MFAWSNQTEVSIHSFSAWCSARKRVT